ncbi:MAG TPA: helix-turn-helix domain-containing protein [Nitrososphaeraceae archaeon]|nr:helix-turn-helix domain-containing protein [Nitrososphaeraceae archaeon]
MIDNILNASLKILAIKGYENATIADISKTAHVSRGILHYYFSDKEDLVSMRFDTSESDDRKFSSIDGKA